MLSRLVRQILQATVYDVAIETPLEAAPRISEKLNTTFVLNVKTYNQSFHLSYAVPITALANSLELNLNVV